jgi:hypothetical protein
LTIIDILVDALDTTVTSMAAVFLMLFLTGIAMEMGVLHRVSLLARPLASLSRLPAVSASSFVVSLGSLLAANTMTARLMDEGHLTKRQAFISALMNSVPVYFRELFTYQLAFVIPVMGMIVGGTYALVFSATGVVKLAIVMILGRRFLDECSIEPEVAVRPRPRKDFVDAIKRSLKGEMPIFMRMCGTFFITTFAVLYLNEMGVLASLDVVTLAEFLHVPPETIIPMTVFVASPKAGMTLLGPMVQNGSLSEVKALIVLMTGSMFMLPFIALKGQIPTYTSVFGMKMGVCLVTFSTVISIVVRFMALLFLMILV